MRLTVHLLLLVAAATAAPVAEDAGQQNILQMLLTADPNENDIIDNNIIEKSKIIENEEFTPTTEYVLDSEIESFTETVQELEPKTVEEDKYDSDSETDSDIELDSGSADEPAESVVPEEVNSINATIPDPIVETEQQVEPNFDTEIIEIIQIGEEYAPTIPESPQYVINFPEATPELETTDIDESSTEDEYESNIEDEQYSSQEWPQRYAPGIPNHFDINAQKPESQLYNNEEWPQRYAPGIPNYFDINAQKPESQLHNNEEWPQRYAPGFPETQQNGQAIDNIPNEPQMSSNIFGNQETPFEYVPNMQESSMIEPVAVGPAYQGWDVQAPGQFVDNGPIVDTFPDVYPDPATFMNYPEVNHFGGDGMEDITIEPIFFNQEPLIYDNTPELSMNEELPEEILEISDLTYVPSANPEDAIELIVIDEEIIDVPQTPIAGEAEQPQDSPIIATAILQDTRPDVDMLGLFGGPEDTIIPEIIEESGYPLEAEDIVEEYLLASEDLPYQTSDQDVITTDNESVAIPNTPEFGEEDFVLDPFAMLPPLVVGLEQAAFPEMPLVNEPAAISSENGPFFPMKENAQRIYFQDNIPEFPSEPDFMGPHGHDEFSFGNDHFQPPHSHNENMNYHYDDYDMPHTHHDQQYNFDNFPGNNYFEDVRGTRKRDGAHMVPDVDMIELPIIETGEMGNFNSPMMDPRNPGPTPQITVIIASKPQLKEIWSQFINPMRQKQYPSVDMTQRQDNVPQYGNMGQYSQNLNTNQFSQNFQGQNFNQQPLQNYNMNQNMNFPQNQLFNGGMGPMGPFAQNFNQQPNMVDMFPNLNMDMPSFEDLPAFVDEEIERAEQMFASQGPISPYGPSMYPFSNNQQTWPNRYAPNYSEFNYLNNGQFYPQRNMNNQFYIP